MLGSDGFDKWASHYDADLSIDYQGYPFEGYYQVLTEIHKAVDQLLEKHILDVGIGTGTLASLFYQHGAKIYGIDFSLKMIEAARKKMPLGSFLHYDFSKGMPEAYSGITFDYIISSYALHHVEDQVKVRLIKEWLQFLAPGGKIIVGDVSFETKAALDACKKQAGEEWDDEEFYMVAEALLPLLEQEGISGTYRQISSCAGILFVQKANASPEEHETR